MDEKIVKLDGTFEEETRSIEKFLGLEPGQSFSEAIISEEKTSKPHKLPPHGRRAFLYPFSGGDTKMTTSTRYYLQR